MFRDLRRKKQALTEAECRDILSRGAYGVLAVAGDDGYPYAVPVNYVLRGNAIYFHSAKTGHKIDAIARNDKVSFCVVDKSDLAPERFTTYFKSVIAFGRARIVDDKAESLDALTALTQTLAPSESPDHQREEIEQCEHAGSVAIVAIDIEHLSGKQAIELVRGKTNDDAPIG